MTSIQEIAKTAGVSVTTVSRVVNGSSKVKESTKNKVLDVIKNSDYKPNSIARRLKSKNYRTKTIGIIFNNAVHPFYFEILKGVYEGLNQKEYNLIIYNMKINRTQIFDMVTNDNLSGLIVVSVPLSEEEKNFLQLNKINYIYLNYYDETSNYITFNNHLGGTLAADFLIKNGAKKIAYVGEKTSSIHQTERYTGFKNELGKHGLSVQMEWYININEQESSELTQDIISKTDIDGIFYYCDTIAYGGLSAINKLKKKILIIGYDDLPTSKYAGLSTIRQPAFFIGYEGAFHILNIISNSNENNIPIIQKCIDPDLINRN